MRSAGQGRRTEREKLEMGKASDAIWNDVIGGDVGKVQWMYEAVVST